MGRIGALWLVVMAMSCSGGPEVEVTVRPGEAISVEPQASVPLQYLPFCLDEGAAVGAWSDSESAARSACDEHRGRYRDHRCTLLWRQRPGTAGEPR